MDEQIREVLLELTDLRKRVLAANDVIGRIFAPLVDEVSPPTDSEQPRTGGKGSGAKDPRVLCLV